LLKYKSWSSVKAALEEKAYAVDVDGGILLQPRLFLVSTEEEWNIEVKKVEFPSKAFIYIYAKLGRCC